MCHVMHLMFTYSPTKRCRQLIKQTPKERRPRTNKTSPASVHSEQILMFSGLEMNRVTCLYLDAAVGLALRFLFGCLAGFSPD